MSNRSRVANGGDSSLQRLFSIFPNGWPGTGLFVLRIASGGYLLAEGFSGIADAGFRTLELLPLANAISGGLLLIGLWTPVAGALVAFLQILTLLIRSEEPKAPGILLICISFAVAMLGPGRWSIDCVLFGRRRWDISDQ